jgi:hypothetical protein
MTTDQIIALFASVGACLSATATFLTVRQIAKQREASYRPDLTLSRIYFEGLRSPIMSGLLPTHWVAKGVASESVVNVEQFGIPLRNVGLGAAKRVMISWSFALDDAVKEVNELAQRTLTPAHLTFDGDDLVVKSEGIGNGVSLWSNQQQTSIDYVMSAAVQKEVSRLTLPDAYVQICSALILLSSKLKEAPLTLPKLPTLRAKMDYFDIAERKHHALFEIELELHAFSGNGESFHAGLIPKKCA